MTTDDLAVLGTVSDAFISACRSVRDDQLDGETPCSEWNVTDLLDHVTGGNRFTVRILGGDAADDALTATTASFQGPHDPAADSAASTRRQRAAFHEGGALDRICDHVAGALPGRHVLRLRLHDLIIHTWDLDEAIGPPAAIPEDHVQWAIAELADPESLTARHMTSGMHRVPRSAEDLLAAFGRHPIR